MDLNEKQRWKLDKTISLPTLLAVGTCATGILWHIAGQDTRITVVEKDQEHTKLVQAATDARQEAQIAELRRQTREDYKAISDKLDRLIEGKRP